MVFFAGSHETADGAFVLDMTEAIKPGKENRLAVRVLNPTYEPIDGIALNETPHRIKGYPLKTGAIPNYGGIADSVLSYDSPGSVYFRSVRGCGSPDRDSSTRNDDKKILGNEALRVICSFQSQQPDMAN